MYVYPPLFIDFAAIHHLPALYHTSMSVGVSMMAVEEGLADVEAGRVTPHEDVVAEMRRRFGGADDK